MNPDSQLAFFKQIEIQVKLAHPPIYPISHLLALFLGQENEGQAGCYQRGAGGRQRGTMRLGIVPQDVQPWPQLRAQVVIKSPVIG